MLLLLTASVALATNVVVFEEQLHGDMHSDCLLNTTIGGGAAIAACEVVVYYGDKYIHSRLDDVPLADFIRPQLVRCVFAAGEVVCRADKSWVRSVRLECDAAAAAGGKASSCVVTFDGTEALSEVLLCVLLALATVGAGAAIEVTRWYRHVGDSFVVAYGDDYNDEIAAAGGGMWARVQSALFIKAALPPIERLKNN